MFHKAKNLLLSLVVITLILLIPEVAQAGSPPVKLYIAGQQINTEHNHFKEC